MLDKRSCKSRDELQAQGEDFSLGWSKRLTREVDHCLIGDVITCRGGDREKAVEGWSRDVEGWEGCAG